jgi:hypothetical protein
VERQPITLTRIAGLVIIAFGTWLALDR